jgi:hypothetical protein
MSASTPTAPAGAGRMAPGSAGVLSGTPTAAAAAGGIPVAGISTAASGGGPSAMAAMLSLRADLEAMKRTILRNVHNTSGQAGTTPRGPSFASPSSDAPGASGTGKTSSADSMSGATATVLDASGAAALQLLGSKVLTGYFGDAAAEGGTPEGAAAPQTRCVSRENERGVFPLSRAPDFTRVIAAAAWGEQRSGAPTRMRTRGEQIPPVGRGSAGARPQTRARHGRDGGNLNFPPLSPPPPLTHPFPPLSSRA